MAAFRLDDAGFALRVLAAVPLIVRPNLDKPAADQLVEKMIASGLDAVVAQSDSQLAYFERAGVRRGPVPRSALGMFIQPNERYRLRGQTHWDSWKNAASIDRPFAPVVLDRAAAVHLEHDVAAPSTELSAPTLSVFPPGVAVPVGATGMSTQQADRPGHEVPPTLPGEPPQIDDEELELAPEPAFSVGATDDYASVARPSRDSSVGSATLGAPPPSRSGAGVWVAAITLAAITAAFAWINQSQQAAPLPVEKMPQSLPSHATTAPMPALPIGLPSAAHAGAAEPAKTGSSRPVTVSS